MIETPKTFWNPTANTTSHRVGRTRAENRRPRWRTNLNISRPLTATSARAAWAGVTGPLPGHAGRSDG